MLIRVNIVQKAEGVYCDFFIEGTDVEEVKKTITNIKSFLEPKLAERK